MPGSVCDEVSYVDKPSFKQVPEEVLKRQAYEREELRDNAAALRDAFLLKRDPTPGPRPASGLGGSEPPN